jgi:hypothetical protein
MDRILISLEENTPRFLSGTVIHYLPSLPDGPETGRGFKEPKEKRPKVRHFLGEG